MVPKSSCLLVNLDQPTYEKLISRLDKNNEWIKVAKECNAKGLFRRSPDEIAQRQKISPGAQILLELERLRFTIKELTEILSICQLKEALLLFTPQEHIQFIKQPSDDYGEDELHIEYGGQLRLEVEVVGNPLPQYEWLHNNLVLEDQTRPVLLKENFTEEDAGEYTCIMKQVIVDEEEEYEEIVELTSNPVEVKLLPEPVTILKQPEHVECRLGEDIVLHCPTEGNPAPVYQWCHGNTALSGHNGETLLIRNATFADSGQYHCYITNGYSEVSSEIITVTVSSNGDPSPVSEKVALLIANDSYDHMEPLMKPMNDVVTLHKILTDLGFKVLSLCNLTLIEMRNAVQKICDVLPDDAYVLFYFAGHGFELHLKCMLPVDVPKHYRYKDCLCEEEVLGEILKKKPRLLFFILDMCLSQPEEEENPEIHNDDAPKFKISNIGRNFIPIYSTASYLKAYEHRSETNGIYMKHLKKYLPLKEPIVKILDLTQDSIKNNEPEAASKQIPGYMKLIVDDHYFMHPSIGNENTNKFFQAWNFINNPKWIPFPRVRAGGLVIFKKYRDCFNNVLEMRIQHLSKWGLKCEVPVPGINMKLKCDKNEIVLTIFDLQKVKLQVALTVNISLMHNDKVVDNYILELSDPPLIISAELWYKKLQLHESCDEDSDDSDCMD